MADFGEMNKVIRAKFRQAPQRLWAAWGNGGHDHEWRLKRFADWFEEIYVDLVNLIQEDEVEDNTAWEALNACTDLLALGCEQWWHLRFIVRIRLWLRPGEIWADYPYDVEGMENSDIEEEEEPMFYMEDHV